MPAIHLPVLLIEVIEWLAPEVGGVFVDATAGGGGHSKAIAERVGAAGTVVAIDRDPMMLELARERLEGMPATLVHSSYDRIAEVLGGLGIDRVDGILADLGFASDQMERADRGFSFRDDGPLDMRFEPGRGTSAAEIVNQFDPRALADVFRELGGEPRARRIAERIIEERRQGPILTTGRLAAIVREALGGGSGRGRTDPATRVFQALRILVNQELEHLDRFLQVAPDLLRPGGRLAVISFHSLEDEVVKAAFRDDHRLEPLTRKPIVAGDRELRRNHRARSAKLRAARRV